VRTVLRHRDLRLLFGALVASATGSLALTEAPQTGALVEDARSRLARTHPTRRLSYESPTPVAPVEGA
jgi:hypothetical protein